MAGGAVSSSQLNMTQLAAVVSRHFPPEARATAVAIAWHESRGNASIVNDKNNNPPGSRDRGLWQINDHWNPSVTDQCAFDPECATAWAAVEYRQRGWKAWRTFDRGAYRPFLESAEAAVEQVNAGATSSSWRRGDDGGWVPSFPDPGDIPDAVDTVGDKVGSAVDFVVPDAVTDAFKFIGKTFRVLVSPDFYKRVGIGLAGLVLIGGAVVWIKRDTIAAAAGGAVTGGASGALAATSAGKRFTSGRKAGTAVKKEAKRTADEGAEAAAQRPTEGVQAGDAARK